MGTLVALAFVVLFLLSRGEAKKKQQEAFRGFKPKNVFGAFDWAKNPELRRAGLFKSGGIHFGFSPDGRRRLNYQKAGHLLIVAAARTGKLLTVICGIVMSLKGRTTLLLIDPKAEITCICGKFRRRFGNVYVWNPYGICLDYMGGLTQAGWNPMSDIDWSSPNAFSDCFKLISTFWKEAGGQADPHWSTSALSLVATIVYTLGRYGKPGEKNLPAMRAVLTGSHGGSIYAFCREGLKINDETVRAGLARFAAPGAEENKELSGIISSAITQTAWLSNPAIAETLQ
jgi:type IV secretory pathway TraG/TraD family ATPase VirD4